MTRVTAGGRLALALLAWLSLAATLGAQDTLARAKALYGDAAYDEALAMLDRLAASPDPEEAAEIAGYRVFCLLALARNDEARRAIETLVKAHPFYRPSEATASPKTRAVFDEVRRPLLPGIAQDLYTKAKAIFDDKQYDAAEQGFDTVIRLLDDPTLSDWGGAADMHTLATGFRDLSHQNAAVEAAARTAAARTAAAAPPMLPTTPPPPRVYTSEDPTVTKPVPLTKTMPVWRPPTTAMAKQEYRGILEVTIDETGAVTSAVLRRRVHPAYDTVLLRAARQWKFKPAMLEGAPVKYRDLIEIRLRPSGQ